MIRDRGLNPRPALIKQEKFNLLKAAQTCSNVDNYTPLFEDSPRDVTGPFLEMSANSLHDYSLTPTVQFHLLDQHAGCALLFTT